MPDWSYHAMFRPVLFRVPARWARDFTLGAMGTIASIPFGIGSQIIEFMGHMGAPASLRRTGWGMTFQSPIALGAGLDVKGVALQALARFGHGFLELGPVTVEPIPSFGDVERDIERQAITYPDPLPNEGLEAVSRRLSRLGKLPVPLALRLGTRDGVGLVERTQERCRLARGLARFADLFVLETRAEAAEERLDAEEWRRHLGEVLQAVREGSPSRPLLLCVGPDVDRKRLDALLLPAVELGIGGVVVGGGIRVAPGRRLMGAPVRDQSLETVRYVRSQWGERLPIIGSGGVHEPGDALRLLEAGATFVQVETGLVFSGPGFTKRTNEVVAHFQDTLPEKRGAVAAADGRAPAARPWWIGSALFGKGLALSGLAAWLLASTRVLLGSDEAFLGMGQAQVAALGGGLLESIARGRLGLGVLLTSLGLVYAQLAFHGIRRGFHWTQFATLISGVLSFASLFLARPFTRPVEPLHLAGVLVLAAGFAVGQKGDPRAPLTQANLRNDWQWLVGTWCQFLLVVLSAGVTIAGVAQVVEALGGDFAARTLAAAGVAPGKVAPDAPLALLLVHERLALGGLMIAGGVTLLLLALWGIRQGVPWLWWTLLLGGLPPVAASVQLALAGSSPWPLVSLPGAAVLLYALVLVLSYPYLCRRSAPPAGELPTSARPAPGAP